MSERSQEERNLETRRQAIEKRIQMNYQDPLYVDPETIPQDMEYKWVRDSLLGVPDKTRMMMQRRLGWVPVPAVNHPEMMPEFDNSMRDSHLDGYIHYSGLVLCQRPKEFGDIERQMETEANYKAMKHIPGLDGSGNPDVPLNVLQHNLGIQKMQSFKD